MGKEELESSKYLDQIGFNGPIWLMGGYGSDGWMADEDLIMVQVKYEFDPDELIVGGHLGRRRMVVSLVLLSASRWIVKVLMGQ